MIKSAHCKAKAERADDGARATEEGKEGGVRGEVHARPHDSACAWPSAVPFLRLPPSPLRLPRSCRSTLGPGSTPFPPPAHAP